MDSFTTYLLSGHWLAGVCLVVAVLLAALLLWQQRREKRWSLPLLVGGAALLLLAAGGLSTIAPEYGMYFAIASLVMLAGMLVLTITTGMWSAPAGYVLGGVLCVSVGVWLVPDLGLALQQFGTFLASLEPLEPWWLVLLLLIPLLLWWSYRSLVGLGATRRVLALALRSVLVLLLAMALSETHAKQQDRDLTVLFLWDRSLSIPPEPLADRDLREERTISFINDAVAGRGPTHAKDQAGVIVFGKRPRLELPPATVPRLGFKKVLSQLDNTYTDIAGAIKLALASFPEGTAKRIVLISDGNENLGQAEEQARLAKQNGVQIDVVPIAAARRSANEVLVERIEAPPYTDKDARVPLRVIIRSYHPQIVAGTLTLTKFTLVKGKNANGDIEPRFAGQPVASSKVKLKQGLNVFYHQQPGARKEDSYTYEAKFVPDHVEDGNGRVVHKGLPGDRIENNRASVNIIVRGERSLLFIESNDKIGEHRLLIDRLRAARPHLRIHTITPNTLGKIDEVPLFLGQYDCVVLGNVPADELDEKHHKALRSNTYDQGCGLIMIGGPQSFGAGGWQNTEVEKALPVTMDIKSMKVESKSGLVLMMHASEMAEGNAWQRKIAKLAIERLSPMDMLGMLYFDHGAGGGHKWHIPFQVVGGNRGGIMALVNSMQPGDMPDCDPQFVMAYKELMKEEYSLGTKHIIFISDGDHWNANPALLAKIKAAKITCTTVCITTHGQAEVNKMKAVAQATGGRAYHITNPAELPAIYIKETRLISQSFVHEKRFNPKLVQAVGPTEGIAAPLPDLFGFVRTSKRSSPLVEMPIDVTLAIGKQRHTFPILAYWQYGLGKSVAFTSDARTQRDQGKTYWDHDWASSDMYTKFWEQVVDYSLRAVDTGQYLKLNTEVRDGKIRLTLEARDDRTKAPITNLLDQDDSKGYGLKVGITSPSLKGAGEARTRELRFEQTSGGVYEAELPAEEVGSYFINVVARWQKDGQDYAQSVRSGVTIPYSPEFAEMESNASLLRTLAHATGGEVYTEGSLPRVAQSGELFRSMPFSHSSLQTLWPWFVVLAALCLLCDIAVRRIAIDPSVVWARGTMLWEQLRGRAVVDEGAAVLERLKSRKQQTSEAMAREHAARRFEVEDGAPTAPVASAAATAAPAQRPTAQKPAPKKQDADDYATRLMKAKKRALEEREKKDKDKP